MRTRYLPYPTSSLDDDDSKSEAKADGRRPSLGCARRPLFMTLGLTLLLLLALGITTNPAVTAGSQATGGGRFTGLTISPSAVAAGARVSFAVAGMEAGEQLRFAPSDGGAEVYATLAANASVRLTLPAAATYSVWRVAGGLADTGLRVVAAEPWPPEPAPSTVSDGAVLSFFAHNFPDRLIAGAGSGVTAEVAPSASDHAASALRLRRQASFRLRLQRCPDVQRGDRGDLSEVFALESCDQPGLVLTRQGAAPMQMAAVARLDCGGAASWQLLSPGLAGEGTLSLVGPRRDATPHAALSVARHAFSVLQSASAASLHIAMADALLVADGSWTARPGLASSCAAATNETVEARGARLLQPSHRLEMALAIGEQPPLPPLQIELYGGLAPKAATNFAQLCSGERGTNTRGIRLHFVGTQLQRVIPGFMAQGGDVQHGVGGFGESVWGGAFDDESFALMHDARGVLSMANTGKDSNRAQFFLLFGPQPHLNGKHVVFGRVVGGLSALGAVEAVGSSAGSTSLPVAITACTVA